MQLSAALKIETLMFKPFIAFFLEGPEYLASHRLHSHFPTFQFSLNGKVNNLCDYELELFSKKK